MTDPYRITSATLVTYSGKRAKIQIQSEVFTEPLPKVKDRILDAFVQMCKSSGDPFVRIENVVTEPLFKKPCC